MKREMTIAEFARLRGVAPRQIRRWLSAGLPMTDGTPAGPAVRGRSPRYSPIARPSSSSGSGGLYTPISRPMWWRNAGRRRQGR